MLVKCEQTKELECHRDFNIFCNQLNQLTRLIINYISSAMVSEAS